MSNDYRVGYEILLRDLDRDGAYEIVQRLLTFDYFDRCSHVDSAFPTAVLRYDETQRKFLPANHMYPDFLLSSLDDHKAQLEELKEEHSPSEWNSLRGGGAYLGRMLEVLLTYLYAGEIEEGWDFFDREYTLADREEMRSKIRARLREDEVYLSLEKHR